MARSRSGTPPGLDFATRGRRVDEAIEVCRRLWTEETVTHHGEFFTFDEVAFEPKPGSGRGRRSSSVASPSAALRRAARLGDGWLGMGHTFESARAADRRRCARCSPSNGRDSSDFQIVLGGPVESRADVQRWEDLGVTRLIVSPWRRSKEALDGLEDFAERVL